MMSNVKNWIGKKFHKLTFIKYVDTIERRSYLWELLCDCGNTTFAMARDITSGRIKSCGCLTEEDIKAFWSKVLTTSTASDCWEFIGTKYHNYGYVHFQGKVWRTHRLAYFLTYGSIPPDILVCHKCDNPPCCNPNHLFLGTQSDNISDMVNKGRCSEGQDHAASFLKEKEIKDIIDRYLQGDTQRSLAKDFEVSHNTIGRIVGGKSWVRSELLCEYERKTDHNRIGNMKLTDKEVSDIKELYSTGKHTQKSIAITYGVHPSTISLIVRGISWKTII